MLPQDFNQGLEEAARIGTAYPNLMPTCLPQGVVRPQMGHTVYVHNPGQQFLVPLVAPSQQASQQATPILPQMNMAFACAPMILDKPVHVASPAVGVAPTPYRPAMYSVAPSTRLAHPVQGNMWASVPVMGRLEQIPGAVVGQATSVEDILQLLRAMPRGASAIGVVSDSLRFLDSRALAALLKELSKTGLREVAFEIFGWLRTLDEQLHPEYAGLLDVFTYTTMIAQCTNQVHLPTALELVSEMRTRNIPLNTHTYSSMLNVCVKVGELDLALDVYQQMLSEGLQPNLVTYNTLLEVYAKRGMWREAVGVLNTLEQQRLVPEPRTFNIVMNACNAAAQYASCVAVHLRMASQQVASTVGTYNAVILAYCKMDQLSNAQQLFREMQQQGCQPTHTTFITLLQSAELHGQAQLAVMLLEQMQSMSLRLTPQCYAAAIGACAAAGQLMTARKLLGDMLASSKAGMAAPAHIIMQLQDKCCDWQGAYRTYQKLLTSGVRPDSQTTATVIEALWGAGNVGSCLLALQVFEGACQQGVFRLSVSVQPGEAAVEFSLPVVGTCMALIGLWRLLAELRGRVARDGARILRDSVVVVFGDGQVAVPNLHSAMLQWCAVPRVPFKVESGDTNRVALTAPAPELAEWLLGDQSLLMCPVMPAAAEIEGLQEGLLQDAEGTALSKCRQQFVEALETDTPVIESADMLPPLYCEARPSLWRQLQMAGDKLQPQSPQLPHAAFKLLDQAAAAGLWDFANSNSHVQEPSQRWLLAACLLFASQALARVAADGDGSAVSCPALSETGLAALFDMTVDDVLLGADRLRNRCTAACCGSITSAYNLLEIYLSVLLAGQFGRKINPVSLVGGAFDLAGHAVSHQSSLGLPASQLAALLVIAGRRSRGLYPVWPKALVVLTGMLHPVGNAQQQFLQELVGKATSDVTVIGCEGTVPS